MSVVVTSIPAGRPSHMATRAGPCDSPAVSQRSMLPILPCPSPGRSGGRLLPYRHMTRARGGERLPLPAGPPLAEPHAGDPRHEVELGRPGVAERREAVPQPTVRLGGVVMRRHSLRDDVILVEPHVGGGHVERLK